LQKISFELNDWAVSDTLAAGVSNALMRKNKTGFLEISYMKKAAVWIKSAMIKKASRVYE